MGGRGSRVPAVVAGPRDEAKATEAVQPWAPKLPAPPWPPELPDPPWHKFLSVQLVGSDLLVTPGVPVCLPCLVLP